MNEYLKTSPLMELRSNKERNERFLAARLQLVVAFLSALHRFGAEKSAASIDKETGAEHPGPREIIENKSYFCSCKIQAKAFRTDLLS